MRQAGECSQVILMGQRVVVDGYGVEIIFNCCRLQCPCAQPQSAIVVSGQSLAVKVDRGSLAEIRVQRNYCVIDWCIMTVSRPLDIIRHSMEGLYYRSISLSIVTPLSARPQLQPQADQRLRTDSSAFHINL